MAEPIERIHDRMRQKFGTVPGIRDYAAAQKAWRAYRRSMGLTAWDTDWMRLPQAERDHWLRVAIAVRDFYQSS